MSGAGGLWVLEAAGQPEGRELAVADDVQGLPRPQANTNTLLTQENTNTPQAPGTEGGPSEEEGGQRETGGNAGESKRRNHVLFQVGTNVPFSKLINVGVFNE